MTTIEEYHRAVTELAHALTHNYRREDDFRDKLLAVLDAHAARVKQDVRAMISAASLKDGRGRP